MSSTARKRAKTDIERQCRACLMKIKGNGFAYIHLPWDQWDTNPTCSLMGLSIAEGLTKLTNVQISDTDPYSKVICIKCCNSLKDAFNFIWTVSKSDTILRYKKNMEKKVNAPSWPKPIQVDKNIVSNAFENEMHVEVKQEVITEDETEDSQMAELSEPRLDIKIEPEEMTPAQIETDLYDAIHDPDSDGDSNQTDGSIEYFNEDMFECMKEEPISDDETELDTDIGKECILCMKPFSTFKGLKAHVIALHSYESVTSPRVQRNNVCAICNRSFATSTDLYVHETCHGKFVCYVCDDKFDTFYLLIKHRSKCRRDTLPRVKTLEDVRRPIYYIRNQPLNLVPQESPPIEDPSVQSHDGKVPTSDEISEDQRCREQESINKEDSSTSKVVNNTDSTDPVFKSNIRLKKINDLQDPKCINNFYSDSKIDDTSRTQNIEPEIANVMGNNTSRESNHNSLDETVEKTNLGLNEPESHIKLENTGNLKEPICKYEYAVDWDNERDTKSQNIEEPQSESNANSESARITNDNTSHYENVEKTDTCFKEFGFKSNIKLKNINDIQKRNCLIKDTLEFNGDDEIGQRTIKQEDITIATQDSTSCDGREGTVDKKNVEDRTSICSISDIEENETQKNDTMEEHIQMETNVNEPSETSICIENNITIDEKKSKLLKSRNADNKQTESVDKTEESSESLRNKDENRADTIKRKHSSEICADINNEMSSNVHQNESEKGVLVDGEELLDLKIVNIVSQSISNEEPKLNSKESKLSDSMKVQLEIHSVNKDEHHMDLDAELNGDIKMDVSE